MSAPDSTVWTSENIKHDVQTLIDYIKENWGYETDTMIEEPEEIWFDHGQGLDSTANKIRQVWMYKRCIKLFEDDTEFALLDMTGNADSVNDTVITCLIYSKVGNTDAEGMYLRFVQLIHDLAKTNEIGVYAYTQSLRKSVRRKRFFCDITFTVLLSRRGIGHA